MGAYLSHFSAAFMWNIPYIKAVLGNEFIKNELTDVSVAANNTVAANFTGNITSSSDTANTTETGSTALSVNTATAADITLTSQNVRFRNNGKRVHLCKLDLPNGALKKVYGSLVASPELLFLELAGVLSIHRLILLGLQLCSHPPGSPSKAITTKRKLCTFLARAEGHRGHRKAMRAVKYVENGSASIMESLAYMILGLPHALGGYGIDGAVYNHEIKLQSEGRKRLSQNRCYADLFYKKAKLAVEYDSFTHHSNPAEQGKDAMRTAVLEKQGVEVVHLSTIQLYDENACKDFAYKLASRLGKRISIRTKKFDEMHALLRELLPDGKPETQTER